MANSDTRDGIPRPPEKRQRSVFDVPSDFFDSCRLLPPHSSYSSSVSDPSEIPVAASSTSETLGEDSQEGFDYKNREFCRWSCNTCKAEFESLQDQRYHFKSDIHRFNVKLSIAGKNVVKEEDFDEMSSESLCKDYDVSSISGSEEEGDKRSCNDRQRGSVESTKQKLVIHLRSGERVSLWKCLLLDDFESILYDIDKSVMDNGRLPCLRESEVIGKLKYLIHEPRDNTRLRVVLLASGGHFAGCVFDGNLVVAHKTFHRYVVRAKSGKKQSSKDGTGKSANSAGASLRRYNELALKKDIQQILADWKPYFDVSCCVFTYAPSSNRQLLFNGEKPYFSCGHCRNVPFSVRRPTLKEARRIYNQLMQVTYEVDEKEFQPNIEDNSLLGSRTVLSCDSATTKTNSMDTPEITETTEAFSSYKKPDDLTISNKSATEAVCSSTPLHEASKSGDVHKVLDFLENGFDPCVKDERGRTPYMLAAEKEVRDTFRRFMAANLEKWDWVAAKVPSALTKEMEESQAAKQAEKDAKKKARAKELKKLRKAREKKTQAEAALSQNTGTSQENRTSGLSVASSHEAAISKEEKLKRAQAEEREKRAAAAERRIAAAAPRTAATDGGSGGSQQPPKSGLLRTESSCSCCHDSLQGKIPFHRYSYQYCSSTCMHLHREILEDG